MSKIYDLVVIGAGPGGYVAAIRAAQRGGKVCVIEKDRVGGICLNQGCIPTKALISCLHVLSGIKEASVFGIEVAHYSVNFRRMVDRSREIVQRLRGGIEYLFKQRKITLLKGAGKVIEPTAVEVDGQRVGAKHIIIATGSSPKTLPFLEFDNARFLSSDDILTMDEVPSRLLIVGGGVMGCEFSSIFSQLGSQVTIVELMPQILPAEDEEIAKKLEVHLKKKKIEIFTATTIEKIKREEKKLSVELSNGKKVEPEKILICVGRTLNSRGLGLEELGIEMEGESIRVNDHLQTNIPTIFAVGDVVGGFLLAHIASYEGTVAAENIFGQDKTTDYRVVPHCIFTDPEIATVGMSEEGAREAGFEVRIGKFPFTAAGKAHAMGETEGFVKIVADATTDEVLGGQIIGHHASDLIAEVALAMKLRAKVSDIADTIHGHPTLAESVMEAAHSVYHQAIHLP